MAENGIWDGDSLGGSLENTVEMMVVIRRQWDWGKFIGKLEGNEATGVQGNQVVRIGIQLHTRET